MLFPARVLQRSASSVQRLVLALLLASSFYFLSSATVSAQAPNPHTAPNTNPDVPQNLHTYTQNVVIELMAAAACQISGIDPINPSQKCLGIDAQTGKIGFVEGGGGAVGLMGNLIAMTYNIPLSSGDYAKYLASNFGLAKPAYAQGVGFQGLNPLTTIWSAFRNIVYLFLVVVFVIVGLAIMLRVRIDPRTVMTIQNQIPKIVIALILITFSFAIAGFLIDLMWVTIYLVLNILSQADPDLKGAMDNLVKATDPINAANIVGTGSGANLGFGDIVGEPSKSVGGLVGKLFNNEGGNLVVGIFTSILFALGGVGLGKVAGIGAKLSILLGKFGGLLGAAVAFVVGGAATAFLGGEAIAGTLGSIIAFLILSIALLWALVRLWFALILAYVYILIDTVLAPFWILAGLIPGSSVTFGAWIRHFLAHVAAFPATIALFLLGMVFIHAFGVEQQNQFVPPLIGNPGSTKAIGALIGLGIILLTPQIVNMLKEALKSPDLKYTAAIGQAVGVGAGVPVQTAKSLGMVSYLSRSGGWGAVARYFLTGQPPPPPITINLPGGETPSGGGQRGG